MADMDISKRRRPGVIHRLLRDARRFRGDASGSIAILAGVGLAVCVLAVGIAIDYSNAFRGRTEFQTACDRGLMAAMRVMEDDQASGQLDLSRYPPLAAKVFQENVRLGSKVSAPTLNSTFTKTNDSIEGRAEFSGSVPTTFGGIVGVNTVPVGGQCASRIANTSNLDIHFLLDTSASMGLPADVVGQALMQKKTTEAVYPTDGTARRLADPNCMFACHSVRPDDPPGFVSTLQIAQENNIRLRVDVERDSVRTVLDLAAASPDAASFRFSLSTFNHDYNRIVEPTFDLTRLKQEASYIIMGYPNALAGDANTFPEASNVFPAFADDLGTYMQSPDAAGRTQFVFLVTDGVRSEALATAASGLVRPFDQAACDAIKATGAQLAVLYTQYLDATGDPIFDKDVKPFYLEIEPNLRACASTPDLFVSANTPEEITDGFTQLFDAARRRLALTQ